MGATLASLPTAVWAHLLSGESSSSSGGIEHAQQQLSRSTSDAFHQCAGSPPPLSHHWEAPHDMDYSSHHHYMMAPPPPNSLLSSNNVPNNHGLSNVHWGTSTGESLHSSLLQAQAQQQQQHCSDYQEPFAPHIVSNAHMNLLQHESPEESRDAKRSAAPNLGNGPEEMSSPDLYKRPRLEQAAACVPFKSQVRKEKLGERITALQQLVSPFGKTDTASVLLEAIGYIKFLQEQVQVLSTPYMKPNVSSGSLNHHDSHELGKMSSWPSTKVKATEDVRQDLRSRGLCLVPVSCTLQVANDNGADFWTPAIGGSCR